MSATEMFGKWSYSSEFELVFNLTNATQLASDSPSPLRQNAPGARTLIFKCFVILIGVIGCVANGIVLRVLLSLKLRTQTSNILITNQVLMDFYSCVLLIADYGSKLVEPSYWGGWGFFMCAMFHSDAVCFIGLTGSIAGVALITAERYFKVVHPIAHRKNFRNWMIYAAIPVTWLNGILMNITALATSVIIDGKCYQWCIWPNALTATAYSTFILLWEYAIPLVMFVYCYWHILLVIRSQMKVFQCGTIALAGNNSDTMAQQMSANKSQLNVIVTMIAISVAFVVCWTPNQVYYVLYMLNFQLEKSLYNVTVFLIFLNTTLNPFIYAAKLNGVKKGLRKLIGKDVYQSTTTTTTTKMTVTTVEA